MRLRTILLFSVVVSAPIRTLEANEPLFTFSGPENNLRQMTFSPDGESLALCDYERLQVRSLRDGSVKADIEVPFIKAVIYLSNKELAGAQSNRVRIWDAETFEQKRVYSADQADHRSCSFLGFIPFPQSDTFTVIMDYDLIFWNAVNGSPYRVIDVRESGLGYNNKSIQFSKDASRFVCFDRNIFYVWDLIDGAYRSRKIELQSVAQTFLDYWLHPDGEIIEIVTQTDRSEPHNRILTYNLESERIVRERTLEGNFQWSSILFFPNGSYFYGSDAFWSVESGQRIATLPQKEYRRNATISPDENKIAFSLYNGDIEVWDISSLRNASGVEGFDRY